MEISENTRVLPSCTTYGHGALRRRKDGCILHRQGKGSSRRLRRITRHHLICGDWKHVVTEVRLQGVPEALKYKGQGAPDELAAGCCSLLFVLLFLNKNSPSCNFLWF